MGSVNLQILMGNCGKEAPRVVQIVASGIHVANFSVATHESWVDKTSGQKMERTTWHRIVAWGGLGDFCGQYIQPGQLVYVQGKTQHREFVGRDGQKVYITEVVAQSIQLTGHQPKSMSLPDDTFNQALHIQNPDMYTNAPVEAPAPAPVAKAVPVNFAQHGVVNPTGFPPGYNPINPPAPGQVDTFTGMINPGFEAPPMAQPVMAGNRPF